jgi:hypothetical protein
MIHASIPTASPSRGRGVTTVQPLRGFRFFHLALPSGGTAEAP